MKKNDLLVSSPLNGSGTLYFSKHAGSTRWRHWWIHVTFVGGNLLQWQVFHVSGYCHVMGALLPIVMWPIGQLFFAGEPGSILIFVILDTRWIPVVFVAVISVNGNDFMIEFKVNAMNKEILFKVNGNIFTNVERLGNDNGLTENIF